MFCTRESKCRHTSAPCRHRGSSLRASRLLSRSRIDSPAAAENSLQSNAPRYPDPNPERFPSSESPVSSRTCCSGTFAAVAATPSSVLPPMTALPTSCHTLRCVLGALLRAHRMPLTEFYQSKRTTSTPRASATTTRVTGQCSCCVTSPTSRRTVVLRAAASANRLISPRGDDLLFDTPAARPLVRRIYPRTRWSGHLLSPIDARARLKERTERRCGEPSP